jgi:hypothetical protein
MSVTAYARARDVPHSTVFEAVRAGLIQARDGQVNVEETDAGWYADHLARKDRVVSLEEFRVRQRGASVVDSMARIAGLKRQVEQIRKTTALRGAIEPAATRRASRLRAALGVLPTLHALEALEGLRTQPDTAQAVLERFAARLAADLGDLDVPYRAPDG